MNRVIDTRKYDTVIIRLRFCENCNYKFKTTEEVIEFSSIPNNITIHTQITK